jgi:hypothetical protein
VGTRRPEIAHLGERIATLDLDQAEFRSDEDIALYVRRLLLAERETRISPYRGDSDAAQQTAAAVARVADGNFLVARIIARSLIERSTKIDLARERIPRNAKEAFAEYLKALAERSGRTERILRESLLPLAYAQGQGLPREVWAALSTSDVDETLQSQRRFWPNTSRMDEASTGCSTKRYRRRSAIPNAMPNAIARSPRS